MVTFTERLLNLLLSNTVPWTNPQWMVLVKENDMIGEVDITVLVRGNELTAKDLRIRR